MGAAVERAQGTDFYPRSPRGERPDAWGASPFDPAFLSTLPARGATPTLIANIPEILFLSTLPARGATEVASGAVSTLKFLSTLPARGATEVLTTRPETYPYFYPRSPRGERRQ